LISKELFDLCQEIAKKRHNGGGETHKPFGSKPASPFWLRGVMVCDKCGTKMVGNSASTRTKSGGQRYYTCGGYLRKGKDFCPYVGWRKERVEELVANKLRTTLLRLSMDNYLADEIRLYHNDKNKHLIVQQSNLEAEISILKKKVKAIEADIQLGKGKPYHQETLDEMNQELHLKMTEYEALAQGITTVDLPDEYIASLKYDIQTFISLLDDEVANPQMLHQLAGKFISKLFIQRETKKMFLTIRFSFEGVEVYEKTIVAEW
jgi:hypothetical protein